MLNKLEQDIGFKFKQLNLLKEAVTHRSYINENPDWPISHNERLEYLGDAVLELAVSDFLFRKYPENREGQLTSLRAALVNHLTLSRAGRQIGLSDHLFLSRGEAKDTGKAREIILADAFEALIGAIYLDQGYQAAENFISRHLLIYLEEIIQKGLYQDPKSLLQEVAQDRFKITPVYQVLDEAGPEHQKNFTVGVFFNEKLIAQSQGDSKQEAERQAAQTALANPKFFKNKKIGDF